MCYLNGTDGIQKTYNHLDTVETGKCNVTKCFDGIVVEEFKYPYMVYCDSTDSEKVCEVKYKNCFTD